MASSKKSKFYATTPSRHTGKSAGPRQSSGGQTYTGCKDSVGTYPPSVETKLDQVLVMLTEQGRNVRDLRDKIAATSTQIEQLQEGVKYLEEKLGTIQRESSSTRPSFRVRTPAELSVRKTNFN